jgi:hypothetical protein
MRERSRITARRRLMSLDRRPPAMSKNEFSGYWRITHTDVWDQKAMDLVAPAHLSFSERRGSLSMIAIEASLHCRHDWKRVEFSLFAADEYDPNAGRGWATIDDGRQDGGACCTSTTAMNGVHCREGRASAAT